MERAARCAALRASTNSTTCIASARSSLIPARTTRVSAQPPPDVAALEAHLVALRNKFKQTELARSKRSAGRKRPFEPIVDLSQASAKKHDDSYYVSFSLWAEHGNLLVTHERYPKRLRPAAAPAAAPEAAPEEE